MLRLRPQGGRQLPPLPFPPRLPLLVLPLLVLVLVLLGDAAAVPQPVQTDGLDRDVIRMLYDQVLERPADTEGLSHYRFESTQGTGVAQIADELLRSKEFRDKHKSELPVEFEQASVWLAKMGNFLIAKEDVHYLYMKLLGREPDERAMSAFMHLIGNPEKRLTVVDMAADVMNSDEFAMVYLYWKLLGRDPDTEGRRHFAELIAGRGGQKWPLSPAQVADELLRSDEFAVRHNLDAKDKSAKTQQAIEETRVAAFCQELAHFALQSVDVTYMYIKFLGRFPDEEAIAHYGKAVKEGSLTLLDMARELRQSEEFNAQGPLALSNKDYLAKILTPNNSTTGASAVWAWGPNCVPPAMAAPSVVEASAMFLVGAHPGVAGNEAPTMVDHTATKSKLSKHAGGVR
jgi:hypothetical protein